jgi:hypothetical protein
MKAFGFLIAAALLAILGIASPAPWGVPYFALCIILSVMGLKNIWRKK